MDIYKQTEKIIDRDIRSFVKEVFDNAPAGFFISPCSGTGKYHPPENQGGGGILRHSIKASEVSLELARMYDFTEQETDIVFASSLIHDILKNGIEWNKSTDYEHGLQAYEWLYQFSLKNPEKDMIRNCVRYHMGRWVAPDSEKEHNPNELERIVQLSDYISSRKTISFLPGYNVPQEEIDNFLD